MNEPPVCVLCEDEYMTRDGCDDGKYCDPCAQERVAELEDFLKKFRDIIEFGPYASTEITTIVLEADALLKKGEAR